MSEPIFSGMSASPGAIERRAVEPGSTVVVVGNAGALMQACIDVFTEESATVVAVVPPDGQAAPVGELRADVVARLPLADADALGALARDCANDRPPVRALVTCHSALELGTIEDAVPARWMDVLRNNLIGPLISAQAFLPALRRSGTGSVVHIGSVDGIQGNPAVPSYSVSKGGLIPLTHLMASEFAKYGVRVNCVARAAVAGGTTTIPDALLAQTPLARAADPREVATAVRFLASQDASYVTGSVLVVDGGRTGITPGTRGMGATTQTGG